MFPLDKNTNMPALDLGVRTAVGMPLGGGGKWACINPPSDSEVASE